MRLASIWGWTGVTLMDITITISMVISWVCDGEIMGKTSISGDIQTYLGICFVCRAVSFLILNLGDFNIE